MHQRRMAIANVSLNAAKWPACPLNPTRLGLCFDTRLDCGRGRKLASCPMNSKLETQISLHLYLRTLTSLTTAVRHAK